MKNNATVLPVSLVHHTELQNFLIAPRNYVLFLMIQVTNKFNISVEHATGNVEKYMDSSFWD